MIKQPVIIPVYADLNGIHQVQLYRHSDDGTFRRTGVEPLRMLRENITGILSCSKGELISAQADHEKREWFSPTIKLNSVHCQSYYRYLRNALRRNQLLVAVTPGMYSQMRRFTLHELTFKFGVSHPILRLIRERYTESLDLWVENREKQDNSIVLQLSG